MNKTISKYISELLYLHNCVIIPEFGGFIGNNKSAVLNEITGRIFPPSKEILFNPNLKSNDGLLVNKISVSEGISNIKATENINNYVSKIIQKLEKIGVFRIEDVGLLSLGKDGNILFLQDSHTNYNLDSFGLSPQKTKKTNHLENKIEAITEPISFKKGRKKIWKEIAILVPIVGLSLISITQEDKIENMYTQISGLKLFTNSETINKPQNEIKKDIEIIISPEENKNNQTDDFHEFIEKKYFLIAGSFSEEKNANNLVDQLRSENYNSEIIGKSENGLTRVSYDSFVNKNEALIALEKLKLKNKSSWILSK